MQQNYRIFLASSYELKADREQFEIFINRQNNLLKDKGVYLQLVLWEDIGAEIYPVDKQEQYNEELRTCDIFVMLYWSKVGKYTNIEFERALGQFRYTRRNPQMYIFEKTARVPRSQTAAERDSIAVFKEKFGDARQFLAPYKQDSELINLFHANLDQLFAKRHLIYGSITPAECLYTDGNSVPMGFIGRQDELIAIKEKLKKGGSLMLINAEGGIGKTTLAAKYWEDSLYDYKFNAWLFCEDGIIPAIKKLAPRLGVDLKGMTGEQQIEALKNKLLPMSKDILFVLDNADKGADIEEFRDTFRGFQWHVLITSRRSDVLNHEQELPIYHLPPLLARQLFESNYNEHTPEFEALLDRLLAAIGYHTLLVEIFSKNMTLMSEYGDTLADFLAHLEKDGLLLKERSFRVKIDYVSNRHREAKNTDEIIGLLYDFGKLDKEERYLMINLALLPAINYKLIFLIDLLIPEDKYVFGETLKRLAGKGWLGYSKNGYRMSPVIQQLMLKKNENSLQQDCKKLIDNLTKKLENDGPYLVNLSYNKAAPFAQLVPTITDNFKEKVFQSLGVLNKGVFVYYIGIGDLPNAKKAAQKFEQICAALNDKENLAISYSNLGVILQKLGDADGSLNYHQRRLELSEHLYKENPGSKNFENGLAIAYQHLGGAYYQSEDFEKALVFFQKFNELMEEICKTNPDNPKYENGLTISYQRLGNVFEELGKSEKALEFYQKDNELREWLSKKYPGNVDFKHGLAISYQSLGDVSHLLGNLEKALEFYQKYIKLREQLYEEQRDNVNFKNGLAVSHSKLGAIYLAIEKAPIAETHYLEAQKLWSELTITSPETVDFQKNLTSVNQQLENLKKKQESDYLL